MLSADLRKLLIAQIGSELSAHQLYLAIAIYLGVPGKTITRMFRRNDT